MTFFYNLPSLLNCNGLHPRLIAVGVRAISLSTQDFFIETGIRTNAAQLECWKQKKSKKNGIPEGVYKDNILGTGRGQHQVNLKNGFGYAIDAVPFVNGKSLWASGLSGDEQWDLIFPVADAWHKAAIELDTKIRWGGVWDTTLNNITLGKLREEVEAYKKRHAGPDFLDGPHYELEE